MITHIKPKSYWLKLLGELVVLYSISLVLHAGGSVFELCLFFCFFVFNLEAVKNIRHSY